ncbi:MAG: OmpA/MotB family protein [Planctomycetota bacterium]
MLFHTKKSWLVVLLGSALLMPGCVSRGEYLETQDRLAKAQAELNQTESSLRDTEGMLVDIDGQRSALQDKAAMADQLLAEKAALLAKIEELKKAKAINPIDGTAFFVDSASGQYGYRAQGDVVFAPGSDKITKEGQVILTNLAEELKATKFPITVVGHTDSDPIKLTADVWTRGNIHLGAHRAMSVLEFLVSKGIPEDRISLQSYGPNRPLAEGNSPEAKKKNRRVEIMLGEVLNTTASPN